MKYKKLPNYILKYRKQTGLSQEDIAYLLGGYDASGLSRYEHFSREPSLRIALAFSILFRVPTEKLFAGDLQNVEAIVNRRARFLLERLKTNKNGQATMRKLAILECLAASATSSNQTKNHEE